LRARLHDPAILAASENDLGNLYGTTGRPAEAAAAFTAAIASAQAAGDDALAATAETNSARVAVRRKDWVTTNALLTRAVDTLVRLPPSYSRGMALVSAGSVVLEIDGSIPADSRAIAFLAFRRRMLTYSTMLRFPHRRWEVSGTFTSAKTNWMKPRA
jgi:hypothetical protein